MISSIMMITAFAIGMPSVEARSAHNHSQGITTVYTKSDLDFYVDCCVNCEARIMMLMEEISQLRKMHEEERGIISLKTPVKETYGPL